LNPALATTNALDLGTDLSREPRRPAATLLLLLLLSAAVTLLAFALRPVRLPAELDADAREYFDLAGRVLDGTFQFDSRRVLGHVLVLAALRSLTGENLIALQVLVIGIFAAAAPMATLVARRFTTNERVAISAGILTALWPPFVIYGRTLYSETTALPFFLAFLAALPRGSRLGGTAVPHWRWMVSGAMLAVCLFIRPMYLLFTPFVPLVLWCEEGVAPMAARRVGWLALGLLLTLTPWSIYASLHAGRPIFLSANGGETLAGGLNPTLLDRGYEVLVAPDGRRTWTGPGKWIDESSTGYLAPAELTLPRMQRDQLLKQRTLRWIGEHPRATLTLEGAKLAYMWGIYPLWNGLQQTVLGNLPTLGLLLVAVLALVHFRRTWRPLAMLWAMPLFTSGVALISWGSWRFRQPADVGLLLLAAFFLWARLAPGRLGLRMATRAPLSLSAIPPGP
jgi:hypothetical protein